MMSRIREGKDMNGSGNTASTLFREVKIFNGRSDQLSDPTDVLITGNAIATISAQVDSPAGDEQRTVIDGGGRVLMPGLIDAHAHLWFEMLPLHVGAAADSSYIDLVSGIAAQALLMQGFTTVRDAGGPVFGLKRAIDEGLVVGPRIFPSGAFISQTSGHGDYRSRYEVPRGVCGHLSHQELMGAGAIADGVGEVLRAVREQLMLGASQIKMMAGGGVVSAYDPIDVTEYTEAELRAGVEAAENWGTYVLVHAYTPRAVQQGIRAGVRCIEHGHLLDEETVAMMAEHEVWWSLQPFLDDDDAIPIPDPARRAEQLRVSNGTDTAYQLAKKHQVKLAWGTDTLFDAKLASRRGAQLAKMTRWFTPADVLRMATSVNAELLAMSGERHPYPGRLGVVEEGALADLLLVDGNPLQDLSLVATPDSSFSVIMKDGRIYKDGLAS
jgi:imidazolonepropionase-like amidohydrolase